MPRPLVGRRRGAARGGGRARAENMATVSLRNVKKIYPNAGGEKKKKTKKGEEPAEENNTNLQHGAGRRPRAEFNPR